MILSKEQKNVLREIVKLKSPIQTLGGFAGTGKTTVIRYLTDVFPDFAVCSYTGKAANVLRKKGIGDASTIHSLIYKLMEDQDDGKLYFELNHLIPCSGVIVDEASMVTKEIYDDLRSYGLPLIFVGDHGQLAPVGDDFNLMQSPNFVLETIHRNAGEIAYFAEWLRKGLPASKFPAENRVKLVKGVSNDVKLKADQIICAYNKQRVKLNHEVRKLLGFDGMVQVGDKVMSLRNNQKRGLFNGMQGVITALDGTLLTFDTDNGVFSVNYDCSQFGEAVYEFNNEKDAPHPFDYAYCVTAHKSQGDEFSNVLVYESNCERWDNKRWNYTAASRAKNCLIWSLA